MKANMSHPLNKDLYFWFPITEGGGQRLVDIAVRDWAGANQNWTSVTSGVPVWYDNGDLHFTRAKGDYIDLALLPKAEGDTEFSGIARATSIWFKTESTATTNNFAYGFGNTSPSGGKAWRLSIENGDPYVRVYSGAASWNMSLNDNLWHHSLVQVPQGGTVDDIELFIDGVSQGAGAGSNTQSIDTGSAAHYLGTSIQGGDQNDNFDGELKDYRCWRRQLEPSEVMEVYLDGLRILKQGLVGSEYLKGNMNTPQLVASAMSIAETATQRITGLRRRARR